MRKTIIRGLIVTLCLLLLTTAVVLKMCWRDVFGAWGLYAFVNLVRQGWFGFVLLRFVALFLVFLAVFRLWRWRRDFGASIAIIFIAIMMTFTITKSYSPAGVYGVVFEMGRGGDHYLVLADGKVKEVLWNDFGPVYGHYEKKDGGWILAVGQGDVAVFKLKFSVFGIYLTKIEDPQATNFLPRRIIPFLRPGWMPDWLQ